MNETPAQAPRRKVISGEWGISITLVLIIIGGIASNLLMYSNLSERQVRHDVHLEAAVRDIAEIKTDVKGFTSTTAAELVALRRDNSEIRERLTRVESELKR